MWPSSWGRAAGRLTIRRVMDLDHAWHQMQAAAPYLTAAKPYAPYVAGTLAVVSVASLAVLRTRAAAKSA